VDTRRRLFAGVLLYELLTGTTPFELERLRTAAFEEMMRIIRGRAAEPSTRLARWACAPRRSRNTGR